MAINFSWDDFPTETEESLVVDDTAQQPLEAVVTEPTTEIDLSGFTLPSQEDMDNTTEVEEGSNWWGGFMSGLDSSASFNLARETKALMSSDTLSKYDWFFGKAFHGDKSWTPEKEEGFGWMSTAEQMGVSDEEWDTMEHNERVVQLNKVSKQQIQEQYNPDIDSAGYMISKLVGTITDPTTLIPLKSPSTFAAVGAVDASLYEHSTTGELSPETPVIGAALGFAGGKVVAKLKQRADVKQAKKAMNSLQEEVVRVAADGGNPITALQTAKNNLGVTDDVFEDILNKSKVSPHVPTKEKAVSILEEASASRVRKQSRIPGSKALDTIIEPISEGIKRISPRIHAKLQQAERVQFESSHKYAMMVDPFLRSARKVLTKEQHKKVNLMMLNSKTSKDVSDINNFLRTTSGGESLVKEYKLYREAMDNIHAERVAAGNTKLGKIIGFTHRRVVDYDVFSKSLTGKERAGLDSFLKSAAKKEGAELTDKQRVQAIKQYLKTDKGSKAIRKVASAQQRTVKEVTEEMFPAYDNLEHATHKYIKESQEEIQRYKLFGSKNIDKGDDLDKTIGSFINQELKAGRINEVDVDGLKNLLDARFVFGPKAMNNNLAMLKDVGYMVLLGHTTNAVRQFGDLMLSAYRNGIINTVRGTYLTLSKKGMTAGEMGLLDNIAAEFAADTVTKKTLDAVFKYSGFRAVDALGKGALVNASILKSSKQALTAKGRKEFTNKWASSLGVEDTTQVLKDFKAFKTGKIKKPTQLMKDTAFMDLAGIQPITLLEMPEAYLKNPNGRMLYMLKSFMLKHINLMRQDILKEFSQGSKTKALKNMASLTTLFTLGNMGVDKTIDMMLGRDKELDEVLITNLYRNTGLFSKYDVDSLVRTGDVYDWSVNLVAPPFDPLFKGAVEAGSIAVNMASGDRWEKGLTRPGKDVLSTIPLFGRLMSAWLVD